MQTNKPESEQPMQISTKTNRKDLDTYLTCSPLHPMIFHIDALLPLLRRPIQSPAPSSADLVYPKDSDISKFTIQEIQSKKHEHEVLL